MIEQLRRRRLMWSVGAGLLLAWNLFFVYLLLTRPHMQSGFNTAITAFNILMATIWASRAREAHHALKAARAKWL